MQINNKLLAVIAIQAEIAKYGLELADVMSLVCERTLALIPADGVVVELAEGEDMVYRAASGAAEPYLGLRLRRDASLSGLCVSLGEILRCDDTETDNRVDRLATRKVGVRSMIVMPLKHQGNTVGVVKAMSAQPGSFSHEDEFLLGLLSDVIAGAMFYAARLAQDELYHQATHDSLTGLANRACFMDRLRSQLSRSARDQSRVAVLLLDMNGLKATNDQYGHRVGDASLQEVARRLRAAVRETDMPARLGGDEFAVLLSPLNAPEDLVAGARRIGNAINQPYDFENHRLSLHVSMGAACYPQDSGDLEQLLDLADQRMYAAKRAYYQAQKP